MTTSSNETDSPLSPPMLSASARPGFPWRVFPVGLLYFYGGLLIVLGVTTVFMLLGGCCISVDRNHLASGAQVWGFIVFHILLGVHGCLAIAVGRNLWRRNWKRSLGFFAGAIGAMIMVYVTAYIILSLSPGMQRWPPSIDTVAETAPKS